MIRDVRPDDAVYLAAIYRPYVLQTAITFEITPPDETEFAGRIAACRYPYLVLEEEGEILGYAYASPLKTREAYRVSAELSIYLKPEAKGKGYGRLLYGELEAGLKKQGVTNLYAIVTYCEPENEYLTHDSVKFHIAMGFEKVGHLHECGEKFGRRFDTLYFEKKI